MNPLIYFCSSATGEYPIFEFFYLSTCFGPPGQPKSPTPQHKAHLNHVTLALSDSHNPTLSPPPIHFLFNSLCQYMGACGTILECYMNLFACVIKPTDDLKPNRNPAGVDTGVTFHLQV
jgi:hypothetical protein